MLYDNASRAMFSLSGKWKKLSLCPLTFNSNYLIVQLYQFMYGCEVWVPDLANLATQLQLHFYKIILKLGKSILTFCHKCIYMK